MAKYIKTEEGYKALEELGVATEDKVTELAIKTPEEASVGQTIVVKSVDENGKPTEWESADYQPRTHWEEYETLVLFSQHENEYGAVQTSFRFVEGETYDVLYNGVIYPCTAFVSGTVVLVGNIGLMGGNDTGEPFVLYNAERENAIALKVSDISDGFPSVSVVAKVAHTIPPKYLPKGIGYDEEAVLLPETTVEVDAELGAAVFQDFALEAGKEYTVIYNGVEYTGVECIDGGNGVLLLGNLGAIDEFFPATEHPFVLAREAVAEDENGNPIFSWGVIPVDGSTSVTLSINESKPVTIPPRYLPDSIGYSEYELVLPETEGVLDEEQGIYIFNAYISLVVGKTYIVNYCGVPYKCVADKFGGVLFLGNLGAYTGTGNSGEPFALILENGMLIVAPLSELEGPMTVSITLDNIVPVPAKYLPDSVGYEELEVMVSETICKVDSDSQSFSFECSFVPEVGATYVINHDGISWKCVGSEIEAGDGEVLHYLGNAVFIDGVRSYEPFVLLFHDGICEGIGDSLSETTKISISKKNVRKIPSKYLPDGVPYDETVDLVPETTPIDIEDPQGMLLIMSDVKFTPNETYEVMYAGITYTCTASVISTSDGLATFVGNGAVIGMENTGEPFIMVTYFAESGIAVLPLYDFVATPTVSITKVKVQKISTKCLPEGVGYEDVEIILKETMPVIMESDNETLPFLLGARELIIGKTYTVTFNGEDYTCTAKERSESITGIPLLGNRRLLITDGEDTREPFCIMQAFGRTILYMDSTITELPTVSIVSKTLHKIPEKYLPDELTTKSVFYVTLTNNMGAYSSDVTYAQIQEAYEAGNGINCKVIGADNYGASYNFCLPLTQLRNNSFIFEGVFQLPLEVKGVRVTIDATSNNVEFYQIYNDESVRSIANDAAEAVKNDLLNGAGTAYDTLKELGDLIDTNKDALDVLEEVAIGKADKTYVDTAVAQRTQVQFITWEDDD